MLPSAAAKNFDGSLTIINGYSSRLATCEEKSPHCEVAHILGQGGRRILYQRSSIRRSL
jgi:hypothetical protein